MQVVRVLIKMWKDSLLCKLRIHLRTSFTAFPGKLIRIGRKEKMNLIFKMTSDQNFSRTYSVNNTRKF